MGPVHSSTMLAFIHWVAINRPKIRSLRGIPEDSLLKLANKFELSSGHQNHSEAWRIGFQYLFEGEYLPKEYFKSLGISPKPKKFKEDDDPLSLNRYRRVPLHAVFLYTSEDKAVSDYLIAHWGALDSLSGDYCDIHPSIDQFYSKEDAYEFIERLDVIRSSGFNTISNLPVLFFWDLNRNSTFISFNNDTTENQLTVRIRSIFEVIRIKPYIATILKSKKKLEGELRPNEKSSLYDKTILWFKNQTIVVVILICVTLIVGLGTVADAIFKITPFFTSEISRDEKRTAIGTFVKGTEGLFNELEKYIIEYQESINKLKNSGLSNEDANDILKTDLYRRIRSEANIAESYNLMETAFPKFQADAKDWKEIRDVNRDLFIEFCSSVFTAYLNNKDPKDDKNVRTQFENYINFRKKITDLCQKEL